MILVVLNDMARAMKPLEGATHQDMPSTDMFVYLIKWLMLFN